MLQTKYDEYERLEQDKLLMELLGVSSEREVQNILMSDMTKFTEYASGNTEAFLQDQINAYSSFSTVFNDFLSGYTDNNKLLGQLKKESVDILSDEEYYRVLEDNGKELEEYLEKTYVPSYNVSSGGSGITLQRGAYDPTTGAYYSYNINDSAATIQSKMVEASVRQNFANGATSVDIKLADGSIKTITSAAELAAYSGTLTGEGNVKGSSQYSNSSIGSGGLSNFDPVTGELLADNNVVVVVDPTAIGSNVISGASTYISSVTGNEYQYAVTDIYGNTLLTNSEARAKAVMEGATKEQALDIPFSSSGRSSSTQTINPNAVGQTVSSTASSYVSSVTGNSYKYAVTDKNGNTLLTNSESRANAVLNGATKESALKGKFAEGIENGPVNYTGLTMLHGSKTRPEFVLNADQAYTLLYNLSTNKLKPETASDNKSGDTFYQFQGGITMNGVNDPEEFFKELTQAMSNRFNVTKNK